MTISVRRDDDSFVEQEQLQTQRKLAKNICITGIPSMKNENLMHIFFKLCKAMRINLASDDVHDIYREHSDIIVKFKTMRIKDYLMTNLRHTYLSDVIELPKNVQNCQIYINHH